MLRSRKVQPFRAAQVLVSCSGVGFFLLLLRTAPKMVSQSGRQTSARIGTFRNTLELSVSSLVLCVNQAYFLDQDFRLLRCVSLSRLIRPTTVGFRYAARIRRNTERDSIEIAPAEIRGVSVDAY